MQSSRLPKQKRRNLVKLQKQRSVPLMKDIEKKRKKSWLRAVRNSIPLTSRLIVER